MNWSCQKEDREQNGVFLFLIKGRNEIEGLDVLEISQERVFLYLLK